MPDILPKGRPDIDREELRAFLRDGGLAAPEVALLVRRGYYRDSMGWAGKNDLGIYDDAVALWTPEAIHTFNANADPSVQRPGIATLKDGLYYYAIGTHNISKAVERQYEALVQAGPVTKWWLDEAGVRHEATGFFGINIHHGGYHTTTSEGCITLWPEEWIEFISTVKAALRDHAMRALPVVVSTRPDAKAAA